MLDDPKKRALQPAKGRSVRRCSLGAFAGVTELRKYSQRASPNWALEGCYVASASRCQEPVCRNYWDLPSVTFKPGEQVRLWLMACAARLRGSRRDAVLLCRRGRRHSRPVPLLAVAFHRRQFFRSLLELYALPDNFEIAEAA